MHDERGGTSMDTRTTGIWRIEKSGWGEEDCTELVRGLLNDTTRDIEERYPAILAACTRYGLGERDLWRTMALYLKKGITAERGYVPAATDEECAEKLRKRILCLISKLPFKSLEEFRGLIAFTDAFLSRVRFLCDMLVYLFAEREKGLTDDEVLQPRLYVEFFVGKLFGELETIRQIGQTSSLQDMEGRYAEWLADRILGGEVLV
jgi:hypothetical protein